MVLNERLIVKHERNIENCMNKMYRIRERGKCQEGETLAERQLHRMKNYKPEKG